MTATIEAIETEYAGCRFRSRLEARWAVVFDALGLRWEYEPEGLEFDGVRYLPDFRLPDLHRGIFVEVKGVMTVRDMRKVIGLARHGHDVLVVGGVPRPDTSGPHFFYFEDNVEGDTTAPVRSYRVSLEIGSDSGPMLLPIGWSVDFAPEARLNKAAEGINHPERMQGLLAQAHHSITDAYRAGRSARFDGVLL